MNKSNYWQVTLIVRDDMASTPADEGKYSLTKKIVEEGFRVNTLPLFLQLHDVEAFKIVEGVKHEKPNFWQRIVNGWKGFKKGFKNNIK